MSTGEAFTVFTVLVVLLTTGYIFNVVRRIEADVKAIKADVAWIRAWLDVGGEGKP